MATVPGAIFLSRKANIYDWPGRRKVHSRPVPRWGGVGIFLSVILTLVTIYYVFPQFRELLSYELKDTKSKFISTISIQTQLIGVLLGSTFVLVLGMIDDKKPVRAVTKLLVQIIAAYCAMDFGLRIAGLKLPFGIGIDFRKTEATIFLSQIVSILWLIGFMNTINLADGLDGLASGIAAIASGTFFVVAILLRPDKIWLVQQLQLSAVLSAVLCGACIGFLFFNFHPARVFLGDCGALFIGFFLAGISIIGTLKTPLVIALFIPVIIVALPILDVLLSILRRLNRGTGVMTPDKDHIHHRLLRLGWSHREVVLVMYVITLVMSIISITMSVFKT
ncbi:MAG: undecaprenyl/decaprenyl-phosphate alpha-N-acetylglucosaminyl 1-phosphate transferase [Elusimicrobia bacterium]|nr:undecaprenyl/decaprenyl-phosphate alpha-N-acetylglucosaminyl 1-phosphate transferase [Elusimicrobiota bacterium]